MSQKLLCDECGSKYEPTLKKEVYARSDFEPAEYIRVIKGIAKIPTREQRMMYINGEPLPLDMDGYDCDMCHAKIMPDDKATCLTIWTERRPTPALWEKDFIQ